MDSKLQWWGYLHVSGEVKLKRYFDKRDVDDAMDSDFVKQVCQPFTAGSRDEAVTKINRYFKKD